MSNKTVTKEYALNEFRKVGIVLILYCLFVLYLPLLLNNLETTHGPYLIFGLNAYYYGRFLCLILGTLASFFILRLSWDCVPDYSNEKAYLGLFDHIANFIVFFSCISACIFVTMMIGQYVNISGQLISSIGITFNEEYVNSIAYVVIFILVTPIIEEYAFRGVLLNCLSPFGRLFAILCTSVIYALAHGSFVEMIPAFFMNVILAKMSLTYKTIKPTIIIHILFNASLYGLCIIDESYSLYMIIGLAIVYVLAIVLILTKKYHHISIRYSYSHLKTSGLFFTTFTVIVAMILFILHSVLLIII